MVYNVQPIFSLHDNDDDLIHTINVMAEVPRPAGQLIKPDLTVEFSTDLSQPAAAESVVAVNEAARSIVNDGLLFNSAPTIRVKWSSPSLPGYLNRQWWHALHQTMLNVKHNGVVALLGRRRVLSIPLAILWLFDNHLAGMEDAVNLVRQFRPEGLPTAAEQGYVAEITERTWPSPSGNFPDGQGSARPVIVRP